MFKYELEVQRPLKEVYRAFNNPDNMPRWLTGLQRTEQIEGVPGEVGSKMRQIYLERGRTVELVETVTAHEPEKRFAGHIEGQGVRVDMELEFIDRGDQTGLRVCSDFKSRSMMMSFLLPFIRGGINKRQAGDLARFKELVEAGELTG